MKIIKVVKALPAFVREEGYCHGNGRRSRGRLDGYVSADGQFVQATGAGSWGHQQGMCLGFLIDALWRLIFESGSNHDGPPLAVPSDAAATVEGWWDDMNGGRQSITVAVTGKQGLMVVLKSKFGRKILPAYAVGLESEYADYLLLDGSAASWDALIMDGLISLKHQ